MNEVAAAKATREAKILKRKQEDLDAKEAGLTTGIQLTLFLVFIQWVFNTSYQFKRGALF